MGTFEIVIFEASRLIQPLAEASKNGIDGIRSLIANLGLDIDKIFKPATIVDLQLIINDIQSVDSSLRPIVETGKVDLDHLPELIAQLVRVFDDINDINSLQLNDNVPIEFQNIGRFLLDYLIIQYFKNFHQALYCAFLLVGAIDPGGRNDQIFPRVVYSRIPRLITNLSDTARDVYGWGTNQFDCETLFGRLQGLFWYLGIPVQFTPVDIESSLSDAKVSSHLPLTQIRFPLLFIERKGSKEEVGMSLISLKESSVGSAGIGVVPFGVVCLKEDFDAGDSWHVCISASADAITPWGILIRPEGLSIGAIGNSTPPIKAEISILIERQTVPSEHNILFGSETGTRIELGSVGIKIRLHFENEPDVSFELPIKDLRLIISGGEGDNFLNSILPQNGITAGFDLTFGYSWRSGIYFVGSGGLEIAIPSHISIGPIEINKLTIGILIKEGNLQWTAGASIQASIGPLKATVENIGLKVLTNFVDNGTGNLGPIDLSFGFKPPNGVGLSIDAEVVKGGGYLYFNYDKEEYAGALELTFSDFLSLKAIGLITTRMPDGSKGFSLIVIITAEFTVQLGYGFVFLGAGGIIGLNRTMKLEPLAEGVRTGATAKIMFPANIIENAPKIISDLNIFFPVEEGKFLIGPMVKLGWSTPPLISISLCLIIEIRTNNGGGIERIAILGVLKCILPDEQTALLVLQVNFIGAVDFQKKNAFFFASIFDSRILFITIEGEMGVLVAWGDNPDFVLSVGGFHPRFNPPPLPFPVPKRLSLNILNESWGKIRVEGYLAVTTNTVQFGAKLDLYFGISDFKIEGNLSFDALFQFNPFYFIIEISGKVSLKVCGFDLLSISLKFSLEGTSPWRATGYGKITILFFTIKASFDKTWGESKNTQLPPIQIIPILRTELENIRNWQAIPPKSNNLSVTLREQPVPATESEKVLALHPIGTLRVSQRAVPLRISIDKVGSQKPDDAHKLDFEPSGAFISVGDRKESFARAQFQNMDDSKKLSSPSFEKEVGGLELSVTGDQMRFGKITVRHVRYELITIDTAYKRFKVRFFNWLQVLFVHFLANNAACRSSFSHRVKKEFQPFDEKIDVLPGAYSVAKTKDNKPYSSESMNFESLASAEEYMNGIISGNPMMADSVHAIPNNEINSAI
jgi:hypothetical protein